MKKIVWNSLLVLTLLAFSSVGIAEANAQSCDATEWNNISKKYNLEEHFFKMQEVVNISPFNQTLYNQLKTQYEQSLTLAERECDAIGADRGGNLSNSQIVIEGKSEAQMLQERIWELEDEERKMLLMDYERALKNAQNACPPNSRLVGDRCYCNNGNILSGNSCVAYVPSPTPYPKQEVVNTSRFSPEFLEHRSKVLSQQTEKPSPTITPTKSDNAPLIQKEVEKEPEKQPHQGFINRIVDLVKNIVSNLFKW